MAVAWFCSRSVLCLCVSAWCNTDEKGMYLSKLASSAEMEKIFRSESGGIPAQKPSRSSLHMVLHLHSAVVLRCAQAHYPSPFASSNCSNWAKEKSFSVSKVVLQKGAGGVKTLTWFCKNIAPACNSWHTKDTFLVRSQEADGPGYSQPVVSSLLYLFLHTSQRIHAAGCMCSQVPWPKE